MIPGKYSAALYISCLVISILISSKLKAQTDTTSYEITLRKEMVVKANDRQVMGMTINGSIPGPTLRFHEGDYAIIYVRNEMDVETSVHWHGLLLPNFYDGVPYLTTPPIMPGETQKYEFPLIQSGTYWYHSHTMLQEQSGIYGSIIIEPEEGESLEYDQELVMVLSDWTNQRPMNVLRNLKRGNEWYNIKKGTATPLNQVIARGAFGAQLNFWKQRMESADIADIYYPAFLVNGEQVQEYSQFKPGEKVRLRIINGAASSQFWMTFGGEDPLLVAADGLNVEPVERNKFFIGIAETYDFIVTMPLEGKIEFRAMAQDGSGHATAYLGEGGFHAAQVLKRPDKIGMMKQMAQMDMRMGAPAMKFKPGKEEPHELMNNWGMQSHDNKNMPGMGQTQVDHGKMDEGMTAMEGGMDMFSEYNYDYLRSPVSTAIDDNKPVRDILLNLTGNMWRYIWSINGVPLSEADMIKVSKGEKVRITFNNLTMMHHPMHLHGHFFRVINEHGAHSPLKHSVNVPPMQKTVIEFDATEDSDWFLHCHVLYHMIGGMARAVSYDTERDPRMKEHPREILFNEGNHFYSWGMADVASHMAEVNLVSSNIRNQFNLNAEVGYNENMEAELTYERYLYDYFRVFAGVNVENEMENSLDKLSATAIAGVRFFTPYMFNLDVRIDNKLRPEIRIGREIMIFPRTVIFGNYEYQADFGWVNSLMEEETGKPMDYKGETTWSVGMEYFLSRNISLMVSYDNRFGAGGGLSIRF
jgi:FtsP/CotA-like multicopper oxidase with cupredoxin domain